MAVNCVNQTFQCLTDTVSLYFDGNRRLYVFNASDTLQQRDVLDAGSTLQRDIETNTKALLQSYYRHVSEGKFRVP